MNKQHLGPIKKDINRVYVGLSNIPKFKPVKSRGMRVTNQGLKYFDFVETPEAQRKGYIENEVCRALQVTLEASLDTRRIHLDRLYGLFSDDKETMAKLILIDRYNKELD